LSVDPSRRPRAASLATTTNWSGINYAGDATPASLPLRPSDDCCRGEVGSVDLDLELVADATTRVRSFATATTFAAAAIESRRATWWRREGGIPPVDVAGAC
jgi:hypothetical protein